MNYKVLYVEDLNPDAIKNGLEHRNSLTIDINDASNFENFLDKVKNSSYDGYILDYRLTSNKGQVDAPAYASMLRSAQADKKAKISLNKAPIILLSTEDNLTYFEKDFTSQDLFDLVVEKPVGKNVEKYQRISTKIKSIIDAYKTIIKESYNLKEILKLASEELGIIDYHLEKDLDESKEKDNTYAFCRTIYQTLVRSSGLLVGEDILAARLGVNKNKEGWKEFLDSCLSKCKYEGILSSAYDRWWMHRVLDEWNKWSSKKLHRLTAEERVEIINSKYFNDHKTKLEVAKPIKHNEGTCFWTICAICREPLDPMEAYLYNKRDRKSWEESDYASLNALLENPKEQKYLSPMSKREVESYK